MTEGNPVALRGGFVTFSLSGTLLYVIQSGCQVESTVDVQVRKAHGSTVTIERDLLAVEEPLEIRLGYHFKGRAQSKSISLTMRTPGNDRELAAGFLAGEGIIRHASEIAGIRHIGTGGNELLVDLDQS